MASIKRRGDNAWRVQIRKKGHPPIFRTFDYKVDAENWAREIEREMDFGTFKSAKEAEQTTFKDLAKKFAEDFAPFHYKGKAWKFKLEQLKETLDDYAISAISSRVVTEYRDARLKSPDSRYKSKLAEVPRVSAATVKSELDLLSKVFDVAEKEFCIAIPGGNPVRGVRKPAGGKTRDRRLTAKEHELLIVECDKSGNPWLKASVELAIQTGMRQGELLKLEWKNVHLKNKFALLEDTKNKESRAVPLSKIAIDILKALQKNKINTYVIPIDRMTLYKAFVRACDRAKISDFTFHDLRHEALSRLAERGDFSVLEIASISGHKTLQVLKRYTHFQAERLAEKLG